MAFYTLSHRHAVRLWRDFLEYRSQTFAHIQSLTEGIKELALHAERRLQFYDLLLIPTLWAYTEKITEALQRYSLTQSTNQFTYFFVIVLLYAANHYLAISIDIIAAYALIIII